MVFSNAPISLKACAVILVFYTTKRYDEWFLFARWDEQTYYSLAESSDKSHRKLTKLVAQYDEVLEVSSLKWSIRGGRVLQCEVRCL